MGKKAERYRINEVEAKLRYCGAAFSDTYYPFGWILRNGIFIQDHAIDPGFRKILEIFQREKINMNLDDAFSEWIRIEGLAITFPKVTTKTQIDGFVCYMKEFPSLYNVENFLNTIAHNDFEFLFDKNNCVEVLRKKIFKKLSQASDIKK